jgi:hypothetical protein
MTLLNSIKTDRNIIGVDWSRSGVDVYDPQTGSKRFPSLEAVAESYPGSMLVLEATSESYELQRRSVVLEAFKKYDVSAYCYHTQRTAKFRIENNINKSDASDAKVIYRIATETPLSLHRFESLLEDDVLRDGIEQAVIEDRYLRDGASSALLAKEHLSAINIPSEFQEFIFSGKKYRKQVGRILLAAAKVRKAGRGYREFRRVLGNYSNGFGSILRSEFYWWWVRTVLNARLKKASIKKTYFERADEKTGKNMKIRRWSEQEIELRKQTMKDATKAAQFLWSATRNELNPSTYLLA